MTIKHISEASEPPGDLISVVEAAKRLDVNPQTVRRWIRSGGLPAYRRGTRFLRLSWREVLAAMAKHRGPDLGGAA